MKSCLLAFPACADWRLRRHCDGRNPRSKTPCKVAYRMRVSVMRAWSLRDYSAVTSRQGRSEVGVADADASVAEIRDPVSVSRATVIVEVGRPARDAARQAE